jgi:hypothetical protein
MFLAVRMAVILSVMAVYLLLSQAFYLLPGLAVCKDTYLSILPMQHCLQYMFLVVVMAVISACRGSQISAFYLLPGVAVCKVHFLDL